MSLSWFIFITGVILLLSGLIYRRWGLKGLSYTRTFSSSAVFEGEEVEMVERIQNNKILPLPWLKIESKISPNLQFYGKSDLIVRYDEFHQSLFSLMPYTGITRRHRILCKARGCYRLSSATMTCGDAFGIQEIFTSFGVNAELLVYPKPALLEDIPFETRSWMGDVVVRRWIMEDPFIVSGVREYQSGDPMNRIDWKATARTGDFKVRNMDFTANPRIMIILNIDISEAMWDEVTDKERLEKAISFAAAIVQYGIENGIPAGFGSNAYDIDDKHNPIRIEPQLGREHLLYIYAAMARLIINRSCTFYTFLENEIERDNTPTDYLILTVYVSDRMQEQLSRLRVQGHSVEIIDLNINNDEGQVSTAV